MFFRSIPVLVSGLALASAQGRPATVTEGNPPGVVYRAVLPDLSSTNIRGSVSGVAGPGGEGVTFSVSLSGFPTSGGPFPYHVHVAPVPASGNCTDTLGHLDPTERGEEPPCDSSQPQTCQVGDLAGKHGKASTDPFTAKYTDKYLSTVPGSEAFFGNRSLVVHFANKTRITCANFALVSNGTGPPSPVGSGSPGGSGGNSSASGTFAPPSPTSPPLIINTGAASLTRSVGLGAGLFGLFALFL